MHISKILVMTFPLILVGCSDFFDEDSDSFSSSPPAPAPTSPSAPAGCGCPVEKPQQTPAAAVPPPASTALPSGPVPDWHPSEGHLVRAGDLVMELKNRNGGRNPSHTAMATHIQTHMGLTPHQAEMVLEELGL